MAVVVGITVWNRMRFRLGNIRTLAEGVETETQLRFLKEIGCDLVQGFYFYKPEPLEVSIQRFRHRSADIPCESDEERRRFHELSEAGDPREVS